MITLVILLTIATCDAMSGDNYLGNLYGLPQQVQETPHVALAKAQDFSAIYAIKAINAVDAAIPAAYKSLSPVQGTPDIAAANTRQFAAHAEAAVRSGVPLTYSELSNGVPNGANLVFGEEHPVNKVQNAASYAEARARNTGVGVVDPWAFADRYSHLVPWMVGQGIPGNNYEQAVHKAKQMIELAEANARKQTQQNHQMPPRNKISRRQVRRPLRIP